MTHTGDARLEPRPTSAAVTKALEGIWHGTLAGPNAEVRVALIIENRPDQKTLATIANLDEGGIQLPVIVTTNGSLVTIESHVVESSFAGELTAGGELVGMFHEGAGSTPMTFRR